MVQQQQRSLSRAQANRVHVGESAMVDDARAYRSDRRMHEPWAVCGPMPIPLGVAKAPMLAPVPIPMPSILADLTVAEFLDPTPAVYAALLRLATSAARRGRLCGGRGRRASWGTPSDVGGLVALPPPRDSGDDEEAAIDAIGTVWARLRAGRPIASPVGRLYTVARNFGRLRAARRIRETSIGERATDRLVPSDVADLTRAQLLAMVPPRRRGAAARALDATDASPSAKVARCRLPAIPMPADAIPEAEGRGGWEDRSAAIANALADAMIP